MNKTKLHQHIQYWKAIGRTLSGKQGQIGAVAAATVVAMLLIMQGFTQDKKYPKALPEEAVVLLDQLEEFLSQATDPKEIAQAQRKGFELLCEIARKRLQADGETGKGNPPVQAVMKQAIELKKKADAVLGRDNTILDQIEGTKWQKKMKGVKLGEANWAYQFTDAQRQMIMEENGVYGIIGGPTILVPHQTPNIVITELGSNIEFSKDLKTYTETIDKKEEVYLRLP